MTATRQRQQQLTSSGILVFHMLLLLLTSNFSAFSHNTSTGFNKFNFKLVQKKMSFLVCVFFAMAFSNANNTFY